MNRTHTGPVGGRSSRAGARPLAARRRRLLAILVVVGVVAVGSIAMQSPDTAWAKDYPSWSDVQNAKNNEAAKKVEISRLQALIKQNEDEVAATQAIADQKGAELQQAQQARDEAAAKVDQLQKQADAALQKANESKRQAGQMAAQLSRAGGSDLSTTLFFNGDNATDLLSQLGMASKINDQSQGLYAKAVQDQNTAQSMTDTANVAKAALAVLAEQAQQAMVVAQAAVDNAARALQEKQDKDATLRAQLASLTDTTARTVADYQAGVKKAQEEAAAALLRAQQAGASGQVGNSGWARPSGGHISSPYGWRLNPYSHIYALHAGVDLAAGCGAPIYAAHAGTVAYAGRNGGYGNYILINNGDGTSTAYGHIVDGGILVHAGQAVGGAQNIARVGSTGDSTGCHLHFEVHTGGAAIEPVAYMRARGIILG